VAGRSIIRRVALWVRHGPSRRRSGSIVGKFALIRQCPVNPGRAWRRWLGQLVRLGNVAS